MTAIVDRDSQPTSGQTGGQDQRYDGQSDIIVDANSRIVGEHGDEVRGPNPAAARGARGREPDAARASRRRRRAMKQIDRRQTCKKTNKPGETDEPQVVLGRQAGEHAKHRTTPRFRGTD